MPRVTKLCERCGKPFTFYTPRGNVQRFCSKACFAATQSKRKTCTCIICGTLFVQKSLSHSETYCSRKCADIGRHKPQNYIEYTCAQCGQPFKRHYAQGKALCCSKDCMSNWLSETTTGANHPRWKGGSGSNRGRNWVEQRQKTLERDGHQCVLCGKRAKRHYPLCVHHIRPYREFNGDYRAANELTNLITLCYWCHPQVENGAISIQRPLL